MPAHDPDARENGSDGPATVSIKVSPGGVRSDVRILISEDEEGSSSMSSVFTLCNSAIGAGVLSLPYAFRKSGECIAMMLAHPAPSLKKAHCWWGSFCAAMSLQPNFSNFCRKYKTCSYRGLKTLCYLLDRLCGLSDPLPCPGRLRSFHPLCAVKIR